jgi:AbrB family looped-hinge helix DNA binding protein
MTLVKTVKVSEKGQIAIPLDVRNAAGIAQGDELVIIEDEGKILLEKPKVVAQKMEDNFKDILRYSEESLKEIWDNEADDIWSSYLE